MQKDKIQLLKRKKEMRRIMSALIVLAMVFALVSTSEARGYFSPCDETPLPDIHPMCWAGYCPDMKEYCDMERRDRDKPPLVTPDPMGSPGI